MRKLQALIALSLILAAHGRLRAAPSDAALPREVFSGDMNQLVSLWRKSCGKAAVYMNPNCRIHECDLTPHSCRPDRLLLFRGESQLRPDFAVSGLYRSALQGSDFYSESGNPRGLAEQLRRELAVLGPMKTIPRRDYGGVENQIVLVRDAGNRGRWYRRYDKDGSEEAMLKRVFIGKYAKTPQDAFTFMETVFYLHKNGPFPDYKDPRLGVISIDPFVSFSLNPELAINFPIQELLMESALKGKDAVAGAPCLIVLSVPEYEIVHQCGEDIQEPGTVLDPQANCRGFNDYNEHELSAFLYAKQEYILGRWPIPADFIEATRPKPIQH